MKHLYGLRNKLTMVCIRTQRFHRLAVVISTIRSNFVQKSVLASNVWKEIARIESGDETRIQFQSLLHTKLLSPHYLTSKKNQLLMFIAGF